MLFSRTAVHGIYTLCYLDRAERGASLSAPAVAVALGIPKEQASKVLQSLNNADLVRSIRGRRGGYVLTKRLADISVLDVLDALDPPEDDDRLRPKNCRRNANRMCSAHRGLLQLNDCVRKALTAQTLAALAGPVCSDADARTERRTTTRIKRMERELVVLS